MQPTLVLSSQMLGNDTVLRKNSAGLVDCSINKKILITDLMTMNNMILLADCFCLVMGGLK